jgi:outer membrane lipoprotein SlyB
MSVRITIVVISALTPISNAFGAVAGDKILQALNLSDGSDHTVAFGAGNFIPATGTIDSNGVPVGTYIVLLERSS